MIRFSFVRVGLVALLVTASAVSFAIVPEGNLVDNTNTNAAIVAADVFNPVVRISTNLGSGRFSVGSGSVFGKQTKEINGVTRYFVCVLTADHVISQNPNNVRIDFMNYYFDNGTGAPPSGPLGGTLPSFVIGRGINGVAGDHPDIAVLGTEVNLATFNKVFTPGVVGWESNHMGTFSLIGYGNTGNRIVDGSGTGIGWTENGITYGTKRYLNGVATQSTYDDLVTYDYDSLEWNIGATHGSAFHGDSGGPLFFSMESNVSALNNNRAYATFIGGVLTGGNITAAGNTYDNQKNWAVDLTNYKGWVTDQCSMVPEPATMFVFAMGIATLVRLRKRTSS